MQIFIDGDACPVKAEVVKVATRYALPVTLVSNQGMRPMQGVKQVIVSAKFDAADDWITGHAGEDDIVITADILLAARCIEKGCMALGNFTSHNIGGALSLRGLNAHLREAGEIRGNNPAFSKKDRSQFLQSLDMLIQKSMQNR